MTQTLSLLVDGYISQSFNSRVAEQYFCLLLRHDSIPPYKTLSYPGIESRCFVVDSTPSNVPVRPSSEVIRVLDRSILAMGTVVPQAIRNPSSVEDGRQPGEAELQMPIFFNDVDGKLGISLERCAAGQCDGLANAQRFVPLGSRWTADIRIKWLGYKEFRCQVPIVHEPITFAVFAHNVGRAVDTFLKSCQPDRGSSDQRCSQWRIGKGGIERSDIMIIGMVQDPAGSWMPILQLTRYIF